MATGLTDLVRDLLKLEDEKAKLELEIMEAEHAHEEARKALDALLERNRKGDDPWKDRELEPKLVESRQKNKDISKKNERRESIDIEIEKLRRLLLLGHENGG